MNRHSVIIKDNPSLSGIAGHDGSTPCNEPIVMNDCEKYNGIQVEVLLEVHMYTH